MTNATPLPLGYYQFPALYADTLIFAAAGDLWRVGVDRGVVTRLTSHPGEVEFWRLPANGVGAGKQLTSCGVKLRWEDGPSPDSKRLAYTAPVAKAFHRLYLFHLETGESTPLTSECYDSYSPAWSRDRAWLSFLSDRHLHTLVPSPWGPCQPDRSSRRPPRFTPWPCTETPACRLNLPTSSCLKRRLRRARCGAKPGSTGSHRWGAPPGTCSTLSAAIWPCWSMPTPPRTARPLPRAAAAGGSERSSVRAPGVPTQAVDTV